MFRKNHILLALALSFSASAHALTGGPFDNGDYSQLLDDNAIYQATFTMSNGIGFAQFGSNASLGPSISTATGGGGSQQTTNSNIGTILDRSVFYYKGLTYFGTATGIVDLSAKSITGITNGSTDVTLSQTGTNTTTNVFFGTSGQVNASTNVINNGGIGYVANSEWTGTILEKTSMLTFNGKGSFTVINPDLNSQIYTAISSLIAQIPTVAGNSTSTSLSLSGFNFQQLSQALFNASPLGQVVQAINTLLTLDVSNAPVPSTDSVFQNSDTVPMTVTGSRKFFLSQR